MPIIITDSVGLMAMYLMMAGVVLSRVALGSSNTRCLLYLQVCLYATLEKFQIMFTEV